MFYFFELIMSNNFPFLFKGDMESPVFALPLLLKMEPLIEKLFMYSFSWNFDCSQCGHKYQNRLVSLFLNGHILLKMVPSNKIWIKLTSIHSTALTVVPSALRKIPSVSWSLLTIKIKRKNLMPRNYSLLASLNWKNKKTMVCLDY